MRFERKQCIATYLKHAARVTMTAFSHVFNSVVYPYCVLNTKELSLPEFSLVIYDTISDH